MWYRRHECGLRMAIFFSAATAAGAFGGLLARGINEMTGLGGLKGWQWIFVLEGLLTLIVAIAALFVMNDYPSTAKFLTDDEKTEISRRLEQDRSGLADEFNMKYFWDAVSDWKIYVHMFSELINCHGLAYIYLTTIFSHYRHLHAPVLLLALPSYDC
jgi:MFS family permease